MNKICSVIDCNGKSRSLGYCRKHYMRYKRTGDPTHKNDRMHGMSGTDIHNLWSNLKRDYDICEEWKDFKTFYDDVGERPMIGVMFKPKDLSLPLSISNYYWYWTKSAKELKEKFDSVND